MEFFKQKTHPTFLFRLYGDPKLANGIKDLTIMTSNYGTTIKLVEDEDVPQQLLFLVLQFVYFIPFHLANFIRYAQIVLPSFLENGDPSILLEDEREFLRFINFLNEIIFNLCENEKMHDFGNYIYYHQKSIEVHYKNTAKFGVPSENISSSHRLIRKFFKK